MKIQVINGPNLNLLGTREPEIYGHQHLSDLENLLGQNFPSISFLFLQSNHEGEIIDAIQKCQTLRIPIIINAAGFSHTSVAIHDALKMTTVPKIEVHITNIHQREHFRNVSITAAACDGIIAGLHFNGYCLAVQAILGLSESPHGAL